MLLFFHGVPRICGGVSISLATTRRFRKSSPHLRGCFVWPRSLSSPRLEFPASAGVFPNPIRSDLGCLRVPRICGGVSSPNTRTLKKSESSPHLRGCFHGRDRRHDFGREFPASAGVFPRCGGRRFGSSWSSPHLRGCFFGFTSDDEFLPEFPASAGVFPSLSLLPSPLARVPRICGGVSQSLILTAMKVASSPHLRGCFRISPDGVARRGKFPASAGVFLIGQSR